jgi:hypothetical protein
MASRQEGTKTPQCRGAPEVIRDTQQLARQSYEKLSVVVDTKEDSHLLKVELEACPESARPVDTVREGHRGRNTKTREASRYQAGERE